MLTAEQAIRRLIEGNRRFVAGETRATGVFHDHLIESQEPMAVVLGCSDSRVPPEVLFDQELGDLFVVRVAGNVVAPTQVGSVEFAIEALGTRLVVVLGHSRCGAVTAALDPSPADPSPGLASILDRIDLGPDEPGLAADERLQSAIRANVLHSVEALSRESEALRARQSLGELKIVGAEFDFESGAVEFLE
jgi:carbonic anhydrase